jgi:hypothetical protein
MVDVNGFGAPEKNSKYSLAGRFLSNEFPN